MGKFMKGDVVIIPFPNSDLSISKKRPALVVADLKGDDVILTQITTNFHTDGYSISLRRSDFHSGGIDHDSNIRPNRLFTADSRRIFKTAGKVSKQKTDEVISRIVQIIRSP
ncbi:MAG: type II toxin-antitoxin system PemK/MazF family toxin [Deltaproteobacteria bacterium]|nr:type II toxin-antitoxin system PemK/MazF family toxin [Deltaproteobacteria bacterium]